MLSTLLLQQYSIIWYITNICFGSYPANCNLRHTMPSSHAPLRNCIPFIPFPLPPLLPTFFNAGLLKWRLQHHNSLSICAKPIIPIKKHYQSLYLALNFHKNSEDKGLVVRKRPFPAYLMQILHYCVHQISTVTNQLREKVHWSSQRTIARREKHLASHTVTALSASFIPPICILSKRTHANVLPTYPLAVFNPFYINEVWRENAKCIPEDT